MCCSTKGVKSTVFADNIGNTMKIYLDSSKECALEVNGALGEWVREWLPLICRTEIIRVSLGGFRGGCRKVAKGEERVCGRDRNNIRKKRVECGRDVVWCSKRYRKSVEGRR